MTTPIWAKVKRQLRNLPWLQGRPKILARLLDLAKARHCQGLREYGAPLTAKTRIDWGQYTSEEAADLVAYLEGWAEVAHLKGDAEGLRELQRLKTTALQLWISIEEQRQRALKGEA